MSERTAELQLDVLGATGATSFVKIRHAAR
jgi:hypothetical protein